MDNNTNSYFYYFYCSLFKYIFGQVTLSFKRWVVSTWVARIQKNKNNSNTAEEWTHGHIFVDWTSIRRRDSTWKVRANWIDFERLIHVEIMTLIRGGCFVVDSTFKIDEILMSSPRGFFYVVSTSNRRNFCTRCFHSIIF